MKRISSDSEKLVFELSVPELQILTFVLRSYPMHGEAWPEHPNAPHPSPVGPDPELLTSELRDFKTSLQARVNSFLSEQSPETTKTEPTPSRQLVIQRNNADWLLQVLNEVRVGAWYALGCPDEDRELDAIPSKPDAWIQIMRIEFAAAFQGLLLHELELE